MFVAPVLILDSNFKRRQVGIIGAEFGELIVAGAHEVVLPAIVGGVVGVAGADTGGEADGVAVPYAIFHHAPLGALALLRGARHKAQVGVALAE